MVAKKTAVGKTASRQKRSPRETATTEATAEESVGEAAESGPGRVPFAEAASGKREPSAPAGEAPAKKAPAKKAAAKKAAAKKAAAKKAAAKKAVGAKTAAKEAVGKKTAAKKTP
ncbi:hypothetical protein ACFWV4_28630, partial [Streptomyces fradiae]